MGAMLPLSAFRACPSTHKSFRNQPQAQATCAGDGQRGGPPPLKNAQPRSGCTPCAWSHQQPPRVHVEDAVSGGGFGLEQVQMPCFLPWRPCNPPQLQMGLCPHSPHLQLRLCAWWSLSAELSLSRPSSRLVPCLPALARQHWGSGGGLMPASASAASHSTFVLSV